MSLQVLVSFYRTSIFEKFLFFIVLGSMKEWNVYHTWFVVIKHFDFSCLKIFYFKFSYDPELET